MSHIRAFASHGVLAMLEAGIIALIVLTLVVGPTLAAKGGSGKGPGGGDVSAALVVSPDPVYAYGSEYVVTATGLKPNTPVNIVISMPTCCAFFTVMADGSGNAWFRYTTGDPGTYTVEAHQRLNGRKLTQVASTTFVVSAP